MPRNRLDTFRYQILLNNSIVLNDVSIFCLSKPPTLDEIQESAYNYTYLFENVADPNGWRSDPFYCSWDCKSHWSCPMGSKLRRKIDKMDLEDGKELHRWATQLRDLKDAKKKTARTFIEYFVKDTRLGSRKTTGGHWYRGVFDFSRKLLDREEGEATPTPRYPQNGHSQATPQPTPTSGSHVNPPVPSSFSAASCFPAAGSASAPSSAVYPTITSTTRVDLTQFENWPLTDSWNHTEDKQGMASHTTPMHLYGAVSEKFTQLMTNPDYNSGYGGQSVLYEGMFSAGTDCGDPLNGPSIPAVQTPLSSVFDLMKFRGIEIFSRSQTPGEGAVGESSSCGSVSSDVPTHCRMGPESIGVGSPLAGSPMGLFEELSAENPHGQFPSKSGMDRGNAGISLLAVCNNSSALLTTSSPVVGNGSTSPLKNLSEIISSSPALSNLFQKLSPNFVTTCAVSKLAAARPPPPHLNA